MPPIMRRTSSAEIVDGSLLGALGTVEQPMMNPVAASLQMACEPCSSEDMISRSPDSLATSTKRSSRRSPLFLRRQALSRRPISVPSRAGKVLPSADKTPRLAS